MDSSALQILTLDQHPDVRAPADAIIPLAWPWFMLNDDVADDYWNRLYTEFPEYQFALVDAGAGGVIAFGNCAPLGWDAPLDDLPDDGWDWALARAFTGREAGLAPTLLCALSISIHPDHQGRGLRTKMVSAMRGIGQAHGFDTLIAPVRPSLKSRYPLIPMDEYVTWTTAEGRPFDPWLRVHARLGAEIIRVCPRAMRITGSPADWEEWTGMALPASGAHIIPGALAPVTIDCEAGQGVYVEPNVWMRHTLP